LNKNVVQADTKTFQGILQSGTLVFIDFYADWCGPCKMIASSVDKLAEEFQGKVKFARVNIDENPDIARRFDVRSIPTLMIFRSEKPIRRMVGASPIGHYRGELQKVVSKTEASDQR
jgi:thioredoxin 1